MAKEGFLIERPILGRGFNDLFEESPLTWNVPTDRGGRRDIPGFRHQG